MKLWYALLFTQAAFANPLGEVIAGGDVHFSRPSDAELQVLQNSDRAIVEWQKFSIDAGELTKFIQPGADSVLLNKVMGGDISAIYGKLEANGQIILMNPHGVLVGKSGVIDACAFLATSYDMSNAEFMMGSWDFIPTDITSVINVEGRIEGNCIKIIGDRIFLTGELIAPGGEIEVSGCDVSLLEESLIDVSGTGDAGKVMIDSSKMTQFLGTIHAKGGVGDGGFVEVSGEYGMVFEGFVDTSAPQGKSGMLILDPVDVEIITGGPAACTAVDQFADPGALVQIDPATLTACGTVVIQATQDITVTNAVSLNPFENFTAQAGRNIIVNEAINTDGGNIVLQAGPFSGAPTPVATGSITFSAAGVMNTISGANTGGSITVQAWDISSAAVLPHTTNTGNITFFAQNDMPNIFGGPTIAVTDTGSIRFYANRHITIFPGGFTATGAPTSPGPQIDVRADFDLDGVGDLLYRGISGNSNNWNTNAGGSIFAGGHNVTLLGAQNAMAVNGTIGIVTLTGGGAIEIQARNNVTMQGGMGNGNGSVLIRPGGTTLVRAGNDIQMLGGPAAGGFVTIGGIVSAGPCEFIAGGTIRLIGGTSFNAGTVQIGGVLPISQVLLTAGADIILTAKIGFSGGALFAKNSAFVASTLSPTQFLAGGSILCTNGVFNGLDTGYGGITDNGVGFDVRAGGDVQFARSAHPGVGQSIYIEADATIAPLWSPQVGPYLTNTVLAATRNVFSNGLGGYRTFAAPQPGGIEFVTINGPITLYSAAHFLSAAVDDLVLNNIAVTNATRVSSTTGAIQIGSFHNTDVNNTVNTLGNILIATDNTMNINVPNGFITGGADITLIVDEQTPLVNGGGFFNNFNSGVSTTGAGNKIAIYAASGPTPGSTFPPFPNQVFLGNLEPIITWDINEPLGLISKYDTSFQGGGLVHGSGFGRSYVAGLGVFRSPIIWYKVFVDLHIGAALDAALDSLQQLRALMPERLWVQEFSILVDRKAFRQHLKLMMNHRGREETIQSRFALAHSKDYLLRSTMSGENIRMLDHYQEFEQSPFWRTPDMMNRLEWLEQ